MRIQVCLTYDLRVSWTTLLLTSWKERTRRSPSTCMGNPTPSSTEEQTPGKWSDLPAVTELAGGRTRDQRKTCVYSQLPDLNFLACPSRSGVQTLALCLGGPFGPCAPFCCKEQGLSPQKTIASSLFAATILDWGHTLAMVTMQP